MLRVYETRQAPILPSLQTHTDGSPYTVSLTLGSLTGKDLRDLEELGLLPMEALEDAENDKKKIDNAVPFAGSNVLHGAGSEALPWFETMVEVSHYFCQNKELRFALSDMVVTWSP